MLARNDTTGMGRKLSLIGKQFFIKEVVPTNALTKEIHIRPAVKVIGNTEYYVECFFNDSANMNLSDKVKQLVENDLKSQTEPLLSLQPKVTSHNPAGAGSDKEAEVK